MTDSNEWDSKPTIDDWRAYQPSWRYVLGVSAIWAGAAGLLSYTRIESNGAFVVAGIGGLLACVYIRWIEPLICHLRQDDL
jgi:hypothetical protein